MFTKKNNKINTRSFGASREKLLSSESRISILTAKKNKKLAFAGQRSFESTCVSL